MTLRLVSRLSRASSIRWRSRSKNDFSDPDSEPSRGRLIVTTPTDPVSGFDANSPPPRLISSRLSSRSRQHMLRTSSGFMSELTKFEK